MLQRVLCRVCRETPVVREQREHGHAGGYDPGHHQYRGGSERRRKWVGCGLACQGRGRGPLSGKGKRTQPGGGCFELVLTKMKRIFSSFTAIHSYERKAAMNKNNTFVDRRFHPQLRQFVRFEFIAYIILHLYTCYVIFSDYGLMFAIIAAI